MSRPRHSRVYQAFKRDVQMGMAQKAGIPTWVALSGNLGTKTQRFALAL